MLNILLNILRNGINHRLKKVYCKNTKFYFQILQVLQDNFIILGFSCETNIIIIYLNLKIKQIKFNLVSKPGNKIYISSKQLKLLNPSYNLSIISSNKGIISNIKAKSIGIGGELLFNIEWN